MLSSCLEQHPVPPSSPQHSQFDIYPPLLVETDHQLTQLQHQIDNIIHALGITKQDTKQQQQQQYKCPMSMWSKQDDRDNANRQYMNALQQFYMQKIHKLQHQIHTIRQLYSSSQPQPQHIYKYDHTQSHYNNNNHNHNHNNDNDKINKNMSQNTSNRHQSHVYIDVSESSSNSNSITKSPNYQHHHQMNSNSSINISITNNTMSNNNNKNKSTALVNKSKTKQHPPLIINRNKSKSLAKYFGREALSQDLIPQVEISKEETMNSIPINNTNNTNIDNTDNNQNMKEEVKDNQSNNQNLLKEQIQLLQKQIKQKDIKLTEQITKIQQLTQQIATLQQKTTKTSEQLTETQNKLQLKQKQLLKFIHSQSNFAVQQLTNMQTALLKMKQQQQKTKLQNSKQIQKLQQQIRLLNFTNSNLKTQLSVYKQKQQKQNNKIVVALTEPPINAAHFSDAPSQYQHQNLVLTSAQSTKSDVVIGNGTNSVNEVTKQLDEQIQKRMTKNKIIPKQNKFQILRTVQLQHYYINKRQLTKQQYKNFIQTQKQSLLTPNPLFLHHKNNSQADILNEYNEQNTQKQQQQTMFTRVVSMREHPLTHKLSNQHQNKNNQLNMDILSQILLVPSQSLDHLEEAIGKLTERLKEIRVQVNQSKNGNVHVGKRGHNLLKKQTSISNKIIQESDEMKTTGFPSKIPKKINNTKESINFQNLNKQIYQLAQELAEICKALMSNFEDQIIKAQDKTVIQKIQHEHVVKDVNTQVTETIQQKVEELIQATQNQSPLKIINDQLKKVFQTFFNDSKILIQEIQEIQQPTSQTKVSDEDKNDQNTENQDEQKQIFLILRKLTGLHDQLNRKRKQIALKNKQRMQRLFDVIRSMIISFKISHNSMDKIISTKQLIPQDKSKYLQLRLYLSSLYQALQKDSQTGSVNSSTYSEPVGNKTQQKFTLYQSYEDKLQKLSNQLSRIRLELDHKNREFIDFQNLASTYIQVKKQIQQKQQQNPPETQKQKQKPKDEESPTLPYSGQNNVAQPAATENNQSNYYGICDDISNFQLLRSQLAIYKKKCSEYQTQIGNKKKTQKIIYIRK